MYAVDALRQLAAKLLARAELARFTHQGEALRPFAAVLRHSGKRIRGAETEASGWVVGPVGGRRERLVGGLDPAPPASRSQAGGAFCSAPITLICCPSSCKLSLMTTPHIADSPAVRELAAACVAHAVTAHPRGLGSGWRAVLEALSLAARDSSSAVAGQAADALAPVAEALFRPAGHSLLR